MSAALGTPDNPFKLLDLFSGIGGFSLGLERTGGFKTVAFAEVDQYASAVLRARFPDVPNLGDVTKAEYPDAHVICGGFPCQDISYAGTGAGLAGARSGLFWEVVRAIGLVRPEYVIMENVAALLSRGLDTVLRSLAQVGYDAEWHCIPASAIGAPHRRDRIWIIAYPGSEQHEGRRAPLSGEIAARLHKALANSEGYGQSQRGTGDEGRHTETSRRVGVRVEPSGNCAGHGNGHMADAGVLNVERQFASFIDTKEWQGPDERSTGPCRDGLGWWAVEPDVGRVAHGVPKRVDRLRCLGNAVVPQIPELIGNAILAAHRQTSQVSA